jgi:NAD(P)-dependent dehydrogenase (short-subunit alcohol dehydrogenase family)
MYFQRRQEGTRRQLVARTLEGQRVVVIGASAGIGREIARQAIADGATVMLAARREDRLTELVAEAGGGIPVIVDICNPDSCANLAERARAELGSVDLVVCTAGYSPLHSFDELTSDVWRRVLEINVIGIHQLVRALLPVLSPGGLTAVMSSESTLQPRTNLGAYGSSKAALEFSMRIWRMEQAPLRFTTLVVGGTFPTDFGAEFEMEQLIPAMQSWSRHGTIQEKLMTPEGVASAVVGSLTSIIDQPDISLDTIVIRSPSPVVGDSAHLEAEAADNIAQLNS